MGLASYSIVAQDEGWGAVAGASLTIRQGHEVRVGVPSRAMSGTDKAGTLGPA